MWVCQGSQNKQKSKQTVTLIILIIFFWWRTSHLVRQTNPEFLYPFFFFCFFSFMHGHWCWKFKQHIDIGTVNWGLFNKEITQWILKIVGLVVRMWGQGFKLSSLICGLSVYITFCSLFFIKLYWAIHTDMNGTDKLLINNEIFLKSFPKGNGTNGTLRPLRGTHPRIKNKLKYIQK